MHAFPRSALLLLQNNAISSIIPSTLTDQVDALLDSHNIDDAAQLVDQRRKKLEGNLTVDPDEAEELQYAYQAIGFTCFSETLFEDAGRNLFNGVLDPRVLVSYYPDFHGSLFSANDQVDVYSGVAARMPQEKSVDGLIAMNLVRNYSPHLSPNIHEAPPAVELRRILSVAAREMLLVFLEKSRKRARVEDVNGEITQVVDTILAKLYAHFTRHQDLNTLLSEPNNITLSEIEPSLRTLGLLSPLANLYKQHGEDDKLIELYAGCVEGAFPGSDIQNPLEDMLVLLESRKDKDRVKWGLWMLKKGDVDRGIKLLIPPEAPKRRDRDRDKEDDRVLLEQITEANARAGRRYLEYLVLIKRSMSPDLHTRLALSCIDDLLHCLQDESTAKLWRAKASSYASPRPSPPSPNPASSSLSPSPQPQPPSSTHSSPTQILSSSPPLPPPPFTHPHQSHHFHHQHQQQKQQQSFLSYFASTTPDSTSKRTRLKAVLTLSGSGVYDAQAVQGSLLSGLEIFNRSIEKGKERDEPEEKREAGRAAGRSGSGSGSGSGNVLALECAILEGKLRNHVEALSILVRDLRDSTSAEAYCTLGGEVVPAKQALGIVEGMSEPESSSSSAEGPSLREWYFGLFEPAVSTRTKKGTGLGAGVVSMEAPAIVRQKSVKEDVKNALLRDLVRVYMSDATGDVGRTKRLLDSQASNLDVVDVVALVPDEWPLSSISTFLTRHLRRMSHTTYENMIVKNVRAGQNMSVRQYTWEKLREEDYVIEEPDSEEDDIEGSEEQGETGGDKEKAAAHAQAGEVVEKWVEQEETPSPSLEGDEKSALGLILGGSEEDEPEES